jgi:3-hydroxyisobutyrate dehydrogenase-like beta-hydroxyacid dehydrogenase
MGSPIARRLAERFPTAVFDIDPPRRDGFEGVRASGADLAGTVDVLVTVLPGPAEVRAAVVDDGALAALAPGSLWLDLSSNDPQVSDELAQLATARGVESAAAPMGGGPVAAREGRLTFFLGTPVTTEARVRDILTPLGTPLEPVAGTTPGAAHLAKLLANGLWFGQALAVTESLLLGRAAGLDPESLRALLAGSAAGSVFLDRHARALLEGDPMADFGLDRVVEELDILERLAVEAGTAHDVLGRVAAIHRDALAAYGPVDGELLGARLLLDRSGVADLGAPG